MGVLCPFAIVIRFRLVSPLCPWFGDRWTGLNRAFLLFEMNHGQRKILVTP